MFIWPCIHLVSLWVVAHSKGANKNKNPIAPTPLENPKSLSYTHDWYKIYSFRVPFVGIFDVSNKFHQQM